MRRVQSGERGRSPLLRTVRRDPAGRLGRRSELVGDRSAEEAAGTVAQALDVAAAAGRGDMRERLERTWKRLERTTVTVAVVGEFKTGKSTLINALLGTTICPADDLLSTTAPTIIGWGPTAEARVVLAAADGDAGEEQELEIPVSEVPRYASEAGDGNGDAVCRLVEVSLNRRILESGLCLVDTPGFGGLASGMGELVLGTLAASDAVLLVTDALPRADRTGGRLPQGGVDALPPPRPRRHEDRSGPALADDRRAEHRPPPYGGLRHPGVRGVVVRAPPRRQHVRRRHAQGVAVPRTAALHRAGRDALGPQRDRRWRRQRRRAAELAAGDATRHRT